MLIILDPADTSPLYSQIVQQVVTQIQQGTIAEGERLPSAVELAGTLDLNRNTVLQAYRQLRDEGWLELRRGRGAIAHNPQRTSVPAGLSAQQKMDQLISELAQTASSSGLRLADITSALKQKGLS